MNEPLTISTADRNVITHDGSANPHYDGYNFRLCCSPGEWNNGPQGDTPYKDNVWAWGFNMDGVSDRADRSKPRCAWHLESKFYQDAMQSSPWCEMHFQYYDAAGVASRPITWVGKHDGSDTVLAFNNDRFQVNNKGGTLGLFRVNAATSAVELLNGTHITNPEGGQVDVRPALATSTNPLRIRNAAGAAAGIEFSCGESPKRAAIAVDAGSNVVVGQINGTAGSVYADTNVAFIGRLRTQSLAELFRFDVSAAKFNKPVRLPKYDRQSAPSASASGEGAIYYAVVNGAPMIVCSDGTSWRELAALGRPVDLL